MAKKRTNQTNPEDRKTNRVGALNRSKVESFRELVLDSNLGKQILTMAVTGKDSYDDEDGNPVLGEALPLDIRRDYMKLLASKTIPNPKEITESNGGDNVGLLKQLITDAAREEKEKNFLAEQGVLEAEYEVEVKK